VLGTWDDHDFGRNDAGADYKLKAVTRDLALSFMEVPIGDPRWTREGLYGAYDFGPAGQKTKVILLDNRYFAGEVFTGLGFGLLRIDWSGGAPRVDLEIRDAANEIQNRLTVAVD
jgi:hypothetical protein